MYLREPLLSILLLYNYNKEKTKTMKTLIKTLALLTAALLVSLNIFASGLEFEPEQYIDDIPFNLEKIEKQAKYNDALTVNFTMLDEEYIDDIPFTEDYLTRLSIYANAVSQDFNFNDESYIDDIPKFTSTHKEKTTGYFYAKVNDKR
jgi:hypothetical protein